MSEYIAPLKDMQFVLRELVDLDALLKLPGYQDFDADVLISVLEQAGKFSSEVLSPINRGGDLAGARLENGKVITAPGWRDAYQRFAEDGWNSLGCSAEWGGQGLPAVITALTCEMWYAANMSFGLGPLLTQGAIDALHLAASDELHARYLPKLVSGEWMGTMNLTEPQAGSDLAAVKSRAALQADGSYRIQGQKIFITYGDHDLADNIVHLVLARTPQAPAGVKGLSLFVVPKVLINADGSLGERNAVQCISLEHKLGIHASPTCVMQFGGDTEASGAIGWVVGEENRGLEYMFIMMNAARFGVGMQGVGIAERAYQKAVEYAKDRKQGSDPVTKRNNVEIIHHADVQRMLLTMKATIEAMRALACVGAVANDHARLNPDDSVRQQAQARAAFLTPIIKSWFTDNGVAIASMGVQVHGGMGFIEETGAAQYLRDSRIAPIYEGTNGIQAIDLVGRKLLRDNGAAARSLIEEMQRDAAAMAVSLDARVRAAGERLNDAIAVLLSAVQYTLDAGRQDMKRALAGAMPLLNLFGTVCGGWQLGRAALAATNTQSTDDRDFLRAKVVTARFYADNILCQASGLAHAVIHGGAALENIDLGQF